MIQESSHLVCGGLNFTTAPLALREQVAFRPSQLPEALELIQSKLNLREAVLVSTCNRVEYFGVAHDVQKVAEEWPQFLSHFHEVAEQFVEHSFQLSGRTCVEHLFQVASGIKSMVVGETEIFGQVKQAYELACHQGVTGKWINRLFQTSFAAAKEVRTRTMISRGSVSVGSVAVDLAGKIFGHLPSRRVMVIGAGEISEKTARVLQSRGVETILVANRTYDRAVELARELGGKAITWDLWEKEASGVDIIISSTSAPHAICSKEKLEHLMRLRGPHALFLIDLAVPRDFEPSINQLDDVYLYDIDDLQSIAQRHLYERQAEISRGMDILKPHVTKYCQWVEREQKKTSASHSSPHYSFPHWSSQQPKDATV